MRDRRYVIAVLCLAVGIVLADSAIVTLALPSILRQLDVEVGTVAWVLIAFNLVLAIAAVPAARVCVRGGARPAAVAGLLLFATASAACALAKSFDVLLGARVAQALGGALVISSVLELLVVASGSDRRGAGLWATAGVTGLVVGPVAGGLLTDLVSWQSIFIAQVPLVLLALPVALRIDVPRAKTGPSDRPHLAANIALALLSAALTAALFLLVLLLVDAWRRSPALAAITVTAVPVAALLAGPLARFASAGSRAESIAGSIMIAGGLAALSLLPAAQPLWTVPAQVLVGLGLGLTVDSLTHIALRERLPQTLHGGWTIAARHAGVVLGLAILTPIFTHDLRAAEEPAKEAIAAKVLDSGLTARSKVDLAEGLAMQLQAERGKVPDLRQAFVDAHLPATERPAARRLETALDDQLERAATHAFDTAFLVGALIALMALIPSAMLRDVPEVST